MHPSEVESAACQTLLRTEQDRLTQQKRARWSTPRLSTDALVASLVILTWTSLSFIRWMLLVMGGSRA